MNRVNHRFVLSLSFVTLVPVLFYAPFPVHAQTAGLVCMDVSTSTTCPSSAPTFSATGGSSFTVAVNVQNSDHFNAFDIRIQSDPTILNSTSISMAGSVI